MRTASVHNHRTVNNRLTKDADQIEKWDIAGGSLQAADIHRGRAAKSLMVRASCTLARYVQIGLRQLQPNCYRSGAINIDQSDRNRLFDYSVVL